MATLSERFSAAMRAFQGKTETPPPIFGERAYADPRRLFPGGFSSPYNPSVLVTRKGLGIFDQMRQDDQIKAALSFKKASVLSTGWQIESPEDADLDEVAEFVEQNLKNLDGRLEDDLWEILSALDYGFSVTELVWETRPDGKIGLKSLKTRKPHDFEFETDEFGNLKPNGLRQRQKGFAPTPLPKEKFVIFSHDEEFQNRYGKSDLEAAYRPWWIKDNAYKWLAMLLEAYGVPPVFALYDPTRYSGAQIEDLKKIFQNLQARTSGIIPRPSGASKDAPSALDFWSPELAGQANRVFIPAIEMFDKAIARAILMPGLLGLTADQQQGSFARARVAFDVFVLIIEKLRNDLEERVMMEAVIKPLVDLNFTVKEYPQWKFLPLTDDVRLDILDRWTSMVGSSVVSRQPADEEHIRDLLEFPDLDQAAVDQAAADRAEAAAARGLPVAPTPQGKNETPGQTMTVKTYGRYDGQTDYAQIEQNLDQMEQDALLPLRETFKVVGERFLLSVERNFPTKPKMIDDLDLQGFGDVRDQLREFFRETFGFGQKTLKAEVRKTHQALPIFAPVEALRWLNTKALTVSGIVKDRLIQEAKVILLNALKFGERQSETLRKLRELFAPYVGDPTVITDTGVIEPYRLETILRTNATEAFNQGRLTTAADPDLQGLLRGMAYSAIIDARTTEVCRFLNGKVIPMDEPELSKLAPPNHFNCRSLLVPVTLDMQVRQDDLITASEIGRAEELTPKGFK